MTRRYGNKARTRADKRAAALQFVLMSDKSDAEKVDTLCRSYGFRTADAEKLIAEQRANALKMGVSI